LRVWRTVSYRPRQHGHDQAALVTGRSDGARQRLPDREDGQTPGPRRWPEPGRGCSPGLEPGGPQDLNHGLRYRVHQLLGVGHWPTLAARRPGRGGRRPPQARPSSVGHDLHDGSGAAILRRRAALLEPAHDRSAPPLWTNPTHQDRPKPPEPVSAQRALAVTTSDLLTSGAERLIHRCVVPGGRDRV
jgi:hypothetical protein